MACGLKRCNCQKTRFLTGFSPFSGPNWPILSPTVAYERQ